MTSKRGANVRYYDELADIYPLFFDDLERSMEEEGEWLDRVLRPLGVQRVLDASCGTGRQAIPLARLGYSVTAADPSTSMLSSAVDRSRESGVQIEFLKASFVDLPAKVQRPFDAVITLGNALCHVESAKGIRSSLRALRVCCGNPGVCIVGIKDFEVILEKRKQFHRHRVVDCVDARTVLFEIWDYEDTHLLSTTVVARCSPPNGDAWECRSARTREYMLRSPELDAMARTAGFSEVRRLEHPKEAVFALYS